MSTPLRAEVGADVGREGSGFAVEREGEEKGKGGAVCPARGGAEPEGRVGGGELLGLGGRGSHPLSSLMPTHSGRKGGVGGPFSPLRSGRLRPR